MFVILQTGPAWNRSVFFFCSSAFAMPFPSLDFPRRGTALSFFSAAKDSLALPLHSGFHLELACSDREDSIQLCFLRKKAAFLSQLAFGKSVNLISALKDSFHQKRQEKKTYLTNTSVSH